MKNKIILLAGFAFFSARISAQVSDSVSVGAGYVNESYYSLQDGEVVNSANNTWDLAFESGNFGSAIRVNRLTETYVYPGSILDWETLDTAGIADWLMGYNSDETWSLGALNAPADLSDEKDLGWGIYNTTTHITEGCRIFVLKLQSGKYKKLLIETLGGGIFKFKSSALDNSDLEISEIVKAAYSSKNFIHFSLESNEIVSREPAKEAWDLVFSNYHSELLPGVFYGVTGVLSNRGVKVLQVDGVPTDDASFDAPFSETINTIGHDWKTINMDTYLYDIPEDLTYFIFTKPGDVWKVIFTGFKGSSNGKIYFTKQLMSTASIIENEKVEVNVYPNPTTNFVTITAISDMDHVNIYNLNGQLVYQTINTPLNHVIIDVSDLKAGNYIVEAVLTNQAAVVKQIIITK